MFSGVRQRISIADQFNRMIGCEAMRKLAITAKSCIVWMSGVQFRDVRSTLTFR